jgi:hypothetical protein
MAWAPITRRKITCEFCNGRYSPSVYAKFHGVKCHLIEPNKTKYELIKLAKLNKK